MLRSLFLFLLGTFFLFSAPVFVSAQAPLSDCFREGVYGSETGPYCGEKRSNGSIKNLTVEEGISVADCGCDLCDAIEVGANIILLLTRLVGAVALLMVVYGGISYVLALGNEQSLGRAKQILTNAITGLVIVLVSYLIVSFIIQKLSPGRSGSILWTQFSCTVTTSSGPPLPPPQPVCRNGAIEGDEQCEFNSAGESIGCSVGETCQDCRQCSQPEPEPEPPPVAIVIDISGSMLQKRSAAVQSVGAVLDTLPDRTSLVFIYTAQRTDRGGRPGSPVSHSSIYFLGQTDTAQTNTRESVISVIRSAFERWALPEPTDFVRIQSDCILPGIAAINAIDGFTPEKVILIGDSDSGYPPNADLTSTLEGSCAEDLRPPVPGLQFPTRIADWISWIASVNTNSATIDTIQVGSPAGATTACALVHIAQEFGGTFSWYTCGASCPNDIVNYCNYVVPDAWKYIPACQDGRDNEDETRGRDGLIDYPEDPQCDSPSDISEDP